MRRSKSKTLDYFCNERYCGRDLRHDQDQVVPIVTCGHRAPSRFYGLMHGDANEPPDKGEADKRDAWAP